jgi:pyruvate formate lyase activating enzyme
MAQCNRCKKSSLLISKILPFCHDCIRNHFDELREDIETIHGATRAEFDLPQHPPRDEEGLSCPLCANACRAAEGAFGYCGVRRNVGGRWQGASAAQGRLSWYHDPLPTNCVADWVCPAGTPAGYPKYSYSEGPEYHYANLASFFQSCTFNCLFCQNWHYRQDSKSAPFRTEDEFVASVDKRTFCICWFGGDPGSQIEFALGASKKAIEENKGRILRICWETNGRMNRGYLRQMIALSLESGGCIKFDLKAWDENVHRALTGFANKTTLDNFSLAAESIKERPEIPLLIGSTLMVPGYVTRDEVAGIASFIASLDVTIPYSLLGFHPDFYMSDLPRTSVSHARACHKAATKAGLTNVRIGNRHVLSNDY